MSSKNPKIALLGAGPAGLTLASLLTKNSIPFVAFDLRARPSPDSVNEPSGSLDLHNESGLLALQACGLYEKFKELKSECSEAMILADSQGVVKWQDEGDGQRPEIARNSLTQLLLASIPPEAIKWETKILAVSPSSSSSGKYKLSFESASCSEDQEEEFDLVIGADGAWSKIRPHVTDVQPYFSSISYITLTIPHLTTQYPHFASLVGTGSYSACSESKTVMAQRGSLESARIYLMIKSPSSCSGPENYLRDLGLEQMSAAELKHALVSEGGMYWDWGVQLKELVATGCDAEFATMGEEGKLDIRPLYMLPPGHTWTHRRGLTLIGDAAHLMTPFAGEGVNTAMLDALELSQQIISSIHGTNDGEGESMDDAVRKYEESMFPRVKEVMEESWRNLNMIFSEDSPKQFLEFFQNHGPPPAAHEAQH